MDQITLEDARAIMGDDVLDLDAVQKFFQIPIPDSWRTRLRRIPFESETLVQCKNTHVLFAGMPLSIRDLRTRAKDCFDKFFPFSESQFANGERVGLRWYLLRKDVLPGSKGKAFAEQLSILATREVVPRACEAVYGVTLYFLARGIRLFAFAAARCADSESQLITSSAVHVDVGNFKEAGLLVSLWDDGPSEDIGLASMVIPLGVRKQKPLQR